ncbi:hypothetical protein [Micromonospora purpureochromogenes]|uniref:Uncharacterized protein n=1 Tax=Micromonospora purpureochromogenes TaxID=47872 RepID=A0ABX2RIK4_9ACTN|nr:hypothetical protein [Micromonospora purpureochromogenes]NYF56342.1 hypothetical protein [Micromonospora purpureochromogenes]
MKAIGSRVLLVHAVVVVALAALFLVLYLRSTDSTRIDTDIDLLPVFPFLALWGLGLPWSLEFSMHSHGDVARSVELLMVIGPALVNVVIHALIRLAWIGAKGLDART